MNSPQTVELCVHGVSGTPPQDILHCPPEVLQRVAGDKNAGFYRVREQVDGASHASGSRVREVYSWGELTSGPARRALFLLLLPFTLVNLAHWMLPRVRRQLPANWAVRLLRLFGLSLTLTLQLAVDATVMDAGAWQCASIPQCDTLHLRWAAAVFHRGLNHRLAISALIPAVLILVLVWMAASRRPPFGEPPNPAVDVSAPSPLAHREFWSADRSVQRLRMCHLISWTALLTLVLCGAVMHRSTAGAVISHWAWGIGAMAATSLAVAVLLTMSNRATGRGGNGLDWLGGWLWLLFALSLATLGAAGVLAWRSSPATDTKWSPGSLPMLHTTIYYLLGGQAVVVVVLTVMIWWARPHLPDRGADGRDKGGYRPTLRGYTAVFVATIALLVAGGFSAGLVLWVTEMLGYPAADPRRTELQLHATSEYLGGNAPLIDKLVRFHSDVPLQVPPPFVWSGYVFAGLLVLLGLWVTIIAFRTVPRLDETGTAAVEDDYPPPRPAQQVSAIARYRAWAQMTDRIPRIIACLTFVAVAGLAALLIPAALGWLHGGGPAVATAAGLLALAAAGLIVLAVAGLSNQSRRRQIGILWDVMTFWPRANHPFTPPCYGQWAVPQLAGQLEELQQQHPPIPVVLAAHSQGSIIAAAALLYPNTREVKQVALMTFGSPLRRLFAKNFPAYFGDTTMDFVTERVPDRWINLWACTDPIGSWVFCDDNTRWNAATAKIDVRITDMESLDSDGRGNVPPICGHSGFWDRREYARAVELLAQDVGSAEHNDEADAN